MSDKETKTDGRLNEVDIKKPDVPFVQISNEFLYDNSISFKAKGLYAYMVSKPHGWKFASRRMAREGQDGHYAIQKGLSELIEAGYITSRKNKDGTMQYEMFAKPNYSALGSCEKSAERNNCTEGKLQSGIIDPINNKETLNNTETFKKEKFPPLDIEGPGQTAPAYSLSDLEVGEIQKVVIQ